jgi:hypothetical protein
MAEHAAGATIRASDRRREMFVREFWRDTKRHDEIWAVEICDGWVSPERSREVSR